MKISSVVIVLFTIFMVGCASKYKSVSPQTLTYNSVDLSEGISIEYKYNVLKKKYAKKESKKNVKIVAVKITNNSDRDIVLGGNVMLTYNSGNPVEILDNKVVYKSLKQHPATFLLYLLLTPINAYSTSPTGSSTAIPVGLAIGPGITGGNMLVASNGNRKFKKELASNVIYGKTIKSKETAYGLIGLRSDNYDALKLKIQ